MRAGAKNLMILGGMVITFALVTTSVSLIIYHNSGDIYLDRSRPGFLPDKNEVDESRPTSSWRFMDTGKLDLEVLDEYLNHLKIEVEEIDKMVSPFDETALSDKNLGITGEESSEP